MGNRSLFPGVAVPHAFFGTFFRVERKYDPPSGRQPHRPRRSRRVRPHREEAYACGFPALQWAFLGANNRRGPHCRALRLLFACIPPAPFRKETNFPANGQPFPHTRAAHPHFPIKTGPLSFSESGPCSFSFVSPSARRGRLSRQRRRPTRPQRRCTRRPAWCSAEIHK